jgi:IMP dehydrogenase
VIVVDTAHGHSQGVLDRVRLGQEDFPHCRSSAATSSPATPRWRCVDAGADAVKVGVGPGSICTTRIVAGVGVPQITAIGDGRRGAAGPHPADRRRRHPLLRRHRQGAGRRRLTRDDRRPVRRHRGGARARSSCSRAAATRATAAWARWARWSKGSKDRYFQDASDADKLVPEGIEGRVPYRGPLRNIVHQLVGGLRASMGYVGCATSRTCAPSRASSASPTPACARATSTTCRSPRKRRITAHELSRRGWREGMRGDRAEPHDDLSAIDIHPRPTHTATRS